MSFLLVFLSFFLEVLSPSTLITTSLRIPWDPQLIALYDLVQELGQADFLAALELAAEQQMYGAEYVRAILSPPVSSAPKEATNPLVDALRVLAPTQAGVERNLADYEQYVANWEQLEQTKQEV